MPRSGIREISEYAINKYGKDIIFLGYGQPSDPPPEKFFDILKNLKIDKVKYTNNRGLEIALESISSYINYCYVNPSDITITIGATNAIAQSLSILINPGDEVLIPDPGYPIYESLVRIYGGIPIFYNLIESNKFLPCLDEILTKINNNTKAIILNSPSNPTGSVIDKKYLAQIVNSIAGKLWIITDEVYDKLTFFSEFNSVLSITTDKVIATYSLSKTFNLCGLRIGYLVCKDDNFNKCLYKTQEMFVSCAPFIGQSIIPELLNQCSDFPETMKNKYLQRSLDAKKILCNYLPVMPQGGMYIFVKIPDRYKTSKDFCLDFLEEKRVLVCPGSAFGKVSDRYIRVSMIEEDSVFRYAMESLNEFLKMYN